MHASRIVYSDTLYEFNRGELEASRYYPLGRRGVFAWRGRAGAIVLGRITLAGQSGHFVPPDQRFYGGGAHPRRGRAPPAAAAPPPPHAAAGAHATATQAHP